MKTKICSRCKTKKSLSKFYKKQSNKDGHKYWCIDCCKIYNKYYKDKNKIILYGKYKIYKEKNSDKIKKYVSNYLKDYGIKNKEKLKTYYKKYCLKNYEKIKKNKKLYVKKHKEEIAIKKRNYYLSNIGKIRIYMNNYVKKRYRSNLKFKLNKNMRSQIGLCLNHNKNGSSWESLVGYTLSDLKIRLEKTMTPDMSWQDFLNGDLHLDHIIPKKYFNYTKPEHIDFKKCWALDNLQLLWAEDNMKKNDRLDKSFQPSLQLDIYV